MSSTLLPPNATQLERRIDAAMARILDIPVPTRLVKNPRRAPAAILPWLAWEFSVDEWDHKWSDDQKRAAILSSVEVHRVKGTIGAVRSALDALGYEARVQEWFQQLPFGAPYTFRLLLEVRQIGIDLPGLIKILTVLESAKNLRSHMSEAVLSVTSEAAVVGHVVALSGHEITIDHEPNFRYSDGEVAMGLIMDAEQHGEQTTVSAIDELRRFTLEDLTRPHYWN